MNSTRLPNKVLKTINGKSLLDILISRLVMSKYIKMNNIIIATTNNSSDDEIIKYCETYGFKSFRGSEKDVLSRYFHAAEVYNAKHIIRVTSDCPIFDASVLDQGIELYLKEHLSYCTNVKPPTYPDGLDFSIFSFELLSEAYHLAKKSSEREHVVPWMWENVDFSMTGKFKAQNLSHKDNISEYRWTVDEPIDLENIFTIFSFNDFNFQISWKTVLSQIQSNQIQMSNSHIIRDAGLLKSQKEDKA